MRIAFVFAYICGVGLPAAVLAQPAANTYPAKPVRVIVPFPPGSGVDLITRIVVPRLAEALGQSFVVDNRGGAGGILGTEIAVKAPADGYNLYVGGAALIVTPLTTKVSYSYRDFAPISRLASVPFIVVVHPSMPVNDITHLIKLARAKPGQLDYSSSGKGAPSHLFVEYMKAMAKVDIVEVPYKITAQALTDVIGGQVMMNLPILAAALPHIRGGRLKALAVTSSARAAAAPDIPAMGESSELRGYDAAQWQGLVAPAGTPPDIVARINAELNRALLLPDVKQRIGNLGVEFAPAAPEQFAADIRADTAKWNKLIRTLAIRLD